MKKWHFILGIMFLLFPFFHTHAQSVDILWQGTGYVPPFYQGKDLWANQSVINLLALPQGLGNSKALYYKWSRNGTVLGNVSGVGKSTLSYLDSILSKSQTFKVEILASDEAILATNSIVVSPTAPQLAVYENSPLYGFMFHNEVGSSYPLKESEVTFAGFPLFFSVLSRTDGALRYEWFTGGGTAETRNAVTYRTPADTAGISRVDVRVSNKEKVLQEAKKNFLVQFGKQ